jgi:L-ascorbate metabolism protein UlaG (beta-lactamase superfamily)
MLIKWLGHSSFLITSQDNVRIITDPYTPGGALTYSPINESADIVTISHGHGDHNNPKAVKGSPVILKEPGLKAVKGINFKAVPVFHDETDGSKRGNNLIFCFQIDGLNICHAGDLGHCLSVKQISEIGAVDILLIPVGGYYTIDAAEAYLVVKSLNPALIFPMHYKTAKTSYPITGIEEFLKNKTNIRMIPGSQIEISRASLPKEPEIVVLKSAY